MKTEMDRLTVAGVEIDIIRETGMIPLRPVVERLGLNWSAAYRRLERNHWAETSVAVMAMQADDQQRSHLVVDARTFIMWLATVQASRVGEDIRPTVEAFQLEAANALLDYFTKGVAINPRFPHAVEATEANEGYTLAQAARHLGFKHHAFISTLRTLAVIRKGSDGHHYPAPGFDRWFDVATTNALRVTEEGMDALQQIAKDL